MNECEMSLKKKFLFTIPQRSIFTTHIFNNNDNNFFHFFYALNHNQQKKTMFIKRQFVEYIVNEKKKNGYIIVAQFTPISFVYIGQNYYYDDDVIWNHWPYINKKQKRTRTKAILK
ncbi:hypothetical protein DERF_014989 [Dermatophagoides farinae]|uniref:Uncharacterized protein n=1 Tax=Dermatophagoides farinae TaxID=6954 RepID=A0A922KU57_DERFA|nr:hypothetical protein DERF_014989 [Dermatophagoides farinae]